MTATQYEIITWQSYKQDLGNFRPRVFYAKDLVSPLHDYIHSYGESFRSLQHLRRLFESAIRENTAEDEPDAPAIEIINEVDSEPCPPWEFYYTNRLWLADGIDPPDMSQLVGCDCKGKCDPKSTTCSCLRRQKEYLKSYFDSGFAYDNKGRLRMPGVPIFECNSLCGCDDDECRNRVIQHGRKCHVAIKKTEKKGWGVFATKRIYKGTFIGVYSGEYMRDEDSERRGLVYDKSGRTYLMNCDPYYLKELTDQDDIEYTIDAYHAGNFTRFLNNSCDPNCMVNACYIDEPDIRKPVMTLFSKRDIAAGEELCFSYQGYEPDADDGGKEGSRSIVNKCYCGAANCRGK
ncbi:SET domain-containing protein [Mycena capillaripes]|nr:SET domain-containing protein [Mycena capillaripes]